MARLIDAEKLTDVAQEAYDRWNLAMAGAENQREINKVFKMQELFKAVMYVGDKCPTVEERKTGHWQSDVVVMRMVYTCSVCGERSLCEEGDYDPVLSNYCPNCGAKMEGGE